MFFSYPISQNIIYFMINLFVKEEMLQQNVYYLRVFRIKLLDIMMIEVYRILFLQQVITKMLFKQNQIKQKQ